MVKLYTFRIPFRCAYPLIPFFPFHVTGYYKWERFKGGKTKIGRATNLKWQFSGQVRLPGLAITWYAVR